MTWPALSTHHMLCDAMFIHACMYMHVGCIPSDHHTSVLEGHGGESKHHLIRALALVEGFVSLCGLHWNL